MPTPTTQLPANGLRIRRASASSTPAPGIRQGPEYAKLVDISRCIGCKGCEVACKEWNELGIEPTENFGSYQSHRDLSPDTWLVVGHLDRDLADARSRLAPAALTGALGRVVHAMLAWSGLSAESMVRDDGWQFMEAGRRIERGVLLCQLLRATVTVQRDDATDSLVLESVLVATESIITYRRRYRSRAQVETALDLLLRGKGTHFDARCVEAFAVIARDLGRFEDPAATGLALMHQGDVCHHRVDLARRHARLASG